MTWLWAIVLAAALWAAHWGAERLSRPLKKLRRQWGFSVAAGGSLIGLAAAAPEIGINASSALRRVAEIGLGMMLASNIIAIPLVVCTAYLGTRKRDLPDHGGHPRHRAENLLEVDPQAVWVQALPYLGIVALLAALTLPPGWRGVQPLDGWIMLAAYLVYAAQALLRGRQDGEEVDWAKKEVLLALAGVGAIAAGTYLAVRATEQLAAAWGLSRIAAGMFVTAPVAALPELFATWKVVRSGQVTSGVTSVIGDHAVTLTVALLPLALVTVPVENFRLLWVNLTFVALMPALYAALIYVGRGGDRDGYGFRRWQALLFPVALAAWLLLVVFWVPGVFSGKQGDQSPSANENRPASQTPGTHQKSP
ncbi:sodium:calcium antiporter [Alienimonas sp. DA493]|uniref:sodium:calcium antiporter n=1 Tax=Alienimonas sp. DA493 TaxID=3373605 RepID=UPI00375533F0